MGTNSLHTNQDLFSNHYLKEVLPNDKQWGDCGGIEEAFDEISKLYDDNASSLPNLSEPQLETEFIRPVLSALGHHFIPQPRENTPEGIRYPDYALFDSKKTKQKASPLKGEEWKLFSKAIGLCEAKRWNRKLDLSSPKEPDLFDFERRNPAYQMHLYLLYSEVRWGILTNGRIWRLYEREQSKHLDRYYEVDLVSLINSDGPLFAAGVSRDKQLEAFKYFYMFFRCQAFPRFLDYVLDGSVRYGEAVGAELKDNVYKALRILAQGFVELKENRLEPQRDKGLIRENCFVLLYRLLFILYAEDKLLLPISNRSYLQHYSLESIKEDIYARKDGPPYGGSIPMLWGKLSALSTLIDQGDPGLGIAPYNGGLFNDDQHEFLKKYKIGDRWLAEVIDLLSRPQKKSTAKKEFIDYSSLKIRDLGSIYEGLLENHLEVASEPMVAVKKGKKEHWKPLRERKEEEISKTTDSVGKGEYYPVTERGERKATGSYYTPDYIVKYIVEHTLEPLTKDIKEKELLSLRVLDPAMGSGHFLVEATDFLAPKLLGVKEIEETEDEIGKAKRLIIERCIFGVDKNPLAVELAKLSLWLSTVAANKPLSFLDHHLRPGDSLVGAKVAELGTLPGEETGSLFQSIVSQYSARTIGYYKQIEDEPSDTIDQIDDKIRRLDMARGMMKPFRQAADVWVSTYFGNQVKPKDYSRLVEALRQDDKRALAALEREKWVERANKLWDKHHFFHWELEFPEVFFDKHGRPLANPGFDAVIGNPPYVVVGRFADEKDGGVLEKYQTAGYKYDLYMLFVEKGVSLLRAKGYFSQIFPNRFAKTTGGENLRRFLAKERILNIVDFGTSQVFEGVINYVMIPLVEGKGEPQETFEYRLCHLSPDEVIRKCNVPRSNLQVEGWLFISVKESALYSKLKKHSTSLAEIWESVFAGVQTGLDKVLLIKPGINISLGIENETLKPFLKGQDIRKFALDLDARKIIHPYEKNGDILDEQTIKKRYPGLWKYFEKHKTSLEKRIWFGKTAEEITGKWYGLMYYPNKELISKPKLICPYVAPQLTFTYDDANSLFGVGAGYGIILPPDSPYSPYFLLALLNSTVLNFSFTIFSPEFQAGFKHNEVYLEKLPIRKIDFSSSDDKKMHDDLDEMARNMLDLHKRKQAVIKEYSGWIEHLIGAKLNELSGKDKIRNLEKLADVNALTDLLRKNRKRINFDTADPDNYHNLSKGFEKFKGELDPLVKEINQTDREIDCLVYKLYNLTPEEIEIVEGKGNLLP